MNVPVLHDFPLDPRCYSVRLALALLHIEHEVRPVDVMPGREHLTGIYRDLTPTGTLPVFETGTTALVGSVDVLVHLADGTEWAAPTTDWIDFATGPLEEFYSCREQALYTTDPVDVTAARAAMRTLDDLLACRTTDEAWVATDRPTVADLALFPAAALSRDIGIDHDRYPALRSWIRRIKQRSGFVEMPGIPVFP